MISKSETPEAVAQILRLMGTGMTPYIHTSNGWRFGFSTGPLPAGGGVMRLFTAQLVPVGRGSTVADWEFFGGVSGALGMPSGKVERLSQRARVGDPNRIFDTWWVEAAA